MKQPLYWNKKVKFKANKLRSKTVKTINLSIRAWVSLFHFLITTVFKLIGIIFKSISFLNSRLYSYVLFNFKFM